MCREGNYCDSAVIDILTRQGKLNLHRHGIAWSVPTAKEGYMLKNAILGLGLGAMLAGTATSALAKPASLSLTSAQAASEVDSNGNPIRREKRKGSSWVLAAGAGGLLIAGIAVAASNSHNNAPASP